MKLVTQFTSFLGDTVNLNTTRLQLLENSIDAVKAAVRASSWQPHIRSFEALGSWAHKTIIRPVEGGAFDADLVIYVDPVEGWHAKDYINELYDALGENGTYTDKVRRYSHCVTIEYAGERKIDLTPCVRDRLYTGVDEVCNRNTNAFEVSKPKAYTDWLIGRNAISGSNSFRKVTRLLKYMRDIKTTFTCPSFLLTTLLGLRVYDWESGDDAFADVPTSLKTLMGRLDDWLQANPSKPQVLNPVLPSEVQSNAWDEAKYQNFREKINLYRGWIDDAFSESDREESIGKWRRVFGDDFAKGEAIEKAARISEAAFSSTSISALVHGSKDLVDRVLTMGRSALPPWFARLPHMERPRWRLATDLQLQPQIRAALVNSSRYETRHLCSLESLQRGGSIKFVAHQANGLPLSHEEFDVRWRVTNTDRMAGDNNDLRGGFYPSDEGHTHYEGLRYRGVHMVEAFVVRRRDQKLVGVSVPYMVTIE